MLTTYESIVNGMFNMVQCLRRAALFIRLSWFNESEWWGVLEREQNKQPYEK